ncbi:hypothetical protein BLNAU_23482 [Blattamonas nauphoetae]|uniref:Uncharacterized protein n=1 Tax=Blattamonas nauphoetae TaxID=2049346 RepID=A0ABQ9WU90_9EUKA|nr:hypothetical protein BLNAU_23482 [Blattamonas nauphoetae]
MFPSFLEATIGISRCLEETTQFVLSSSLAPALADSLVFFEDELITVNLLRIPFCVYGSGVIDPAEARRDKQILGKVNEEGMSDECELHFLACNYEYEDEDCLMMGAALIDRWGGNVQFYQG